MARFRCSLCDGRLDSKGRCTFCGLDNTKSDRYYKLNQSDCDDVALTHIHTADGSVKNAKSSARQAGSARQSASARQVSSARQINRDDQNGRPVKRAGLNSINSDDYEKRRKRVRRIVILFVLIIFLMQMIPALVGVYSYSPEFSTIRQEVNDLFGSGSEPFWEEWEEDAEEEIVEEDPEEYEYEYGYDYDDYFEDPEVLEKFLEEYGDDFFDNFDWDFDGDFVEEFITPSPDSNLPSGKNL
ncbi:MAG: hypothetical protein MJ097_07765 [Dorea sp.]|nr:hypothetical protein [Dorea sp.]